MDRTACLKDYENYLRQEDYSEHTISKYVRDIRRFLEWNGDSEFTGDRTVLWKRYLMSRYAPVSVNSMLAALNHFFQWMGCGKMKVRLLRIQKELFMHESKEMTRTDYRRLLEAAENSKNRRLALILRTLGTTGIRISELVFVTVEALDAREAVVRNKGKIRKIFLPDKLCRLLRSCCREQKRKTGPVFLSRNATPLDRSNIWREMKRLSLRAGVEEKKIFPHNLRHLFAKTFYAIDRDIVRLADLLGHSSLSTTRIYIRESGEEHRKQLEQLEMLYESKEHQRMTP